ncbi:hypothetical protein [Streptomyces sp. NPDC056817]|uniref:hypothetical protein n=1 Tax=Streptomyces sp. NPDC056817 TaxID=3345950 RepID=UPI0036BCD9E1
MPVAEQLPAAAHHPHPSGPPVGPYLLQPVLLRPSAATVALISLFTGLFAAGYGIPVGVVLSAMLIALLLAEHLPGRIDARALEHVRTVEGDGPCRFLRRLAALHTSLVQAAAGSDRYELRRSPEIGQHLLWEVAGLLQTQDFRAASDELVARERLMLQLAHQVTQIIERSASEDGAADADQTRVSQRPMDSHPPRVRPTMSPAPRPTASTCTAAGTRNAETCNISCAFSCGYSCAFSCDISCASLLGRVHVFAGQPRFPRMVGGLTSPLLPLFPRRLK